MGIQIIRQSATAPDLQDHGTVAVPLELHPLARWDAGSRQLIVGPGRLRLEASSHWGDAASTRVEVEL